VALPGVDHFAVIDPADGSWGEVRRFIASVVD
jgi:hypothetical protein